MNFRVKRTWLLIPAPLFNGCRTLGKLLSLLWVVSSYIKIVINSTIMEIKEANMKRP